MRKRLKTLLGLNKPPQWCIEVPDGTTNSTRILYGGKPLHGVSRATLDIEAGQAVRLTLEVHPVNLQALLDYMNIHIVTDPDD